MTALFPRARETALAYGFADGPESTAGEVLAAEFGMAQIRTDAWAMTDRRRLEKATALWERLGRPETRHPALTRRGGLDERWAREVIGLAAAAAQDDPGSWGDAPTTWEALTGEVDRELRREFDIYARQAEGGEGVLSGVAGFVGGAAGFVADEENLPFALIGGGGATLARRVAGEAAAGAAGEIVGLPDQIEMERRLGLDPSPYALQVLAGAGFSAALPIAFTGLGRLMRGPRARVTAETLADAGARAEALTARERGAVNAAQAAVDDAALAGVAPPGEHESALAMAERALAGVADPPSAPVSGSAVSPPTSLAARIVGVESGGRADARNPNSSAAGAGQFIGSTWLRMFREYFPARAATLSEAEILALRNDGDLSFRMVEIYATENRAYLGERGLPIHDGALYLAHFAGPEGAAKAFRAAADAPIGEVMSDAAIAANAGIRFNGKPFAEWTAGDLIDWAKSKVGIGAAAWADATVPTRISEFSAGEVLVDAERFQYKLGGDAEGVTGRLLAEEKWSPQAGVGLTFWEAADGRVFVADGHQRSALARRLMAAGHPDIRLQGFLFREADGWSPEMVRAHAALTNIRAETGTAADAAKFLRDYPELAGEVTRARGFMQRADALSRLAPGPYGAVINGLIPENLAAVLGRVAPGDEPVQSAILRAFRQLEPANELEAEMIARDVRRLGLERGARDAQGDLFGDVDWGASPIGDRAKVLDRTLRELKRDRAVFDRLTKEADRIEAEGNRLVRTENEKRAAGAQRLIELVVIAADEPGYVRDALDAAARTARRDGVAAGAREFATAVRRGLDDGEIGRAADRVADRRAQGADAGSRPAPDAGAGLAGTADAAPAAEARVEDWGDPVAGPGAVARAEQAEADLFGEPAAPPAAAAAETTPAAPAEPGLFDRLSPEARAEPVVLDDGPARPLGDVMAELDADEEFAGALALCAPTGAVR